MSSLHKKPVYYERNPKIEWQVIEDEVILIDPYESEMIRFNGTGTRIWQELNGRQSVDEIAEKLSVEFGIVLKKIRKDILKHLKQLVRMELIQERRDPARED
ncbi:MAG: PqqD family protein [Candidatus Omnitrophica bacterium]|nr:PqqD family protein [Candidatus Omnitrophota bacterium]